MSGLFDDLTKAVMSATKSLGLVTADPAVVAEEEREAISRVLALVQGWSVDDRRR